MGIDPQRSDRSADEPNRAPHTVTSHPQNALVTTSSLPIIDRDASHNRSAAVPSQRTKLVSDEIAFGNIRDALALADKCFPTIDDKFLLRGTYALYASQITLRIAPDPVMWGLVKLKHYELHRDESGNAVGFSGLYHSVFDKSTCWLGWLGVDPSQRRSGIGGQIVRGAEEKAKGEGATRMKVYLEADNDPVIKFYEKLGYLQEGEPRKTIEGKMLIYSKALI